MLQKAAHFISIILQKAPLVKLRVRVNFLQRLATPMHFLRRQKRLEGEPLREQVACLLVLPLESFLDVGDEVPFVGQEVLDDRLCVRDYFFARLGS